MQLGPCLGRLLLWPRGAQAPPPPALAYHLTRAETLCPPPPATHPPHTFPASTLPPGSPAGLLQVSQTCRPRGPPACSCGTPDAPLSPPPPARSKRSLTLSVHIWNHQGLLVHNAVSGVQTPEVGGQGTHLLCPENMLRKPVIKALSKVRSGSFLGPRPRDKVLSPPPQLVEWGSVASLARPQRPRGHPGPPQGTESRFPPHVLCCLDAGPRCRGLSPAPPNTSPAG